MRYRYHNPNTALSFMYRRIKTLALLAKILTKMISQQEIVEHLKQSTGHESVIVSGWVKGNEDFILPVVSVTINKHLPNFGVLNVWAHTVEDRDKTTERIVNAIEALGNEGVQLERIHVITFEEKGVLQPGTWKIIKQSKPIFRKAISIRLS